MCANRARAPGGPSALLPVMVALAAAVEERGRLVGRARLHLVVVRLAVAALGEMRCAAAHAAAVRAQGRRQGPYNCSPAPAARPARMRLSRPAWQASAGCRGCWAGLRGDRASEPSARAKRGGAHWATARRSSRPPPRPARPPRASSSAWPPCSSARLRLTVLHAPRSAQPSAGGGPAAVLQARRQRQSAAAKTGERSASPSGRPTALLQIEGSATQPQPEKEGNELQRALRSTLYR